MKRAKRRCAWCESPLPAGSRRERQFCSTRCRVRSWHVRNPSQPEDPRIAQLYSRSNPKHYHRIKGLWTLVGHRENEPWFGSSCPPECPGLREGEEYEPMEEYHRRRVEVPS